MSEMERDAEPMIYENDDAGRPRAVYEIHSGEKRGDSSYRIRSVARGGTLGLTRLLESVFLPAGYPASVSPDYTRYQILNALQGFCSSLAGLIASRAVLEGHGVGQAEASATNALLLTILQDVFSRMTSIISAYYLGTSLSPEAKTYRFLADIFNDIPLLLDTLSPILSHYSLSIVVTHFPPFLCPTFVSRPGSLRGIALCLSGAFRAICGVAAGGSKAALTLHFAQPESGIAAGDISDLSAKDGSKETVLALLGMLCGSAIMPYVQDPQTTYTLLFLLVAAHISINYFAARAVVFRSYNRQRTSILWNTYLFNGSQSPGMTPAAVARHEYLFRNSSALTRMDNGGHRRVIGRCTIGSSFATILPCRSNPPRSLWRTLGRAHRCPWWTDSANSTWLRDLLQLFAGEKYILWFDAHAHGPSVPHLRVVLKAGHAPRDHMKAWLHATELAALRHGPRRGADVVSLLKDVRESKETVDAQFERFVLCTKSAGWDAEAAGGGFVTGSPMVVTVGGNGADDRKNR